MNCADLDPILCDYLDGTLPADQRIAIERHLAECAACAELARDARAAMAFMERVADVDPPQELITKILYQTPAVRGFWKRSGFRGWLNRVFAPVMQPRVVMGAMMTILSLSMMTRCAGTPQHPLSASDLDPIKLWASLDDRAHRMWDRSMKAYESMRLVYEVRSRLRDWKAQQDENTAPVEAPSGARPVTVKPAAAPTNTK
jgi:Putative zinc-finger